MSDTGARFYRIGETKRFEFTDSLCLSASCWSPTSLTNHRNAKIVYTCEHRTLHGCPSVGDRGHSTKHEERRKAENWREE